MPRKKITDKKSQITVRRKKKTEPKLSKFQTFVILLPIIILVFFVLTIGGFFVYLKIVDNEEKHMPKGLTSRECNNGPNPEIVEQMGDLRNEGLEILRIVSSIVINTKNKI